MKRWFLVMVIAGCMAGFWFCSRDNVTGAPEIAIPAMVKVPAGAFEMGNAVFPTAQPVRKITLTDDFHIGKFEVTNKQYADILNYALSKGYLDKSALDVKAKKREARGVSRSPQKYQDVFDEHSQISFVDGSFRAVVGKENFPVVEVTWYGAAFFCNMLSEIEGLTPLYDLDDWSCQVYGKSGYRLPTEAEWEYAARFDDGRPFPWGTAVLDDSRANAAHNVKNPVDVDTRPVGSFSPDGDSKLGICDLIGNVSEWCNDWYNDLYTGSAEQSDPIGAGQTLFFNLPVFKEYRCAKVVRGGRFLFDPNYRKEMGAPFVMDTVIHIDVYKNTYRSYDYLSRQVIGFRVVKTVATEKTKPAVLK